MHKLIITAVLMLGLATLGWAQTDQTSSSSNHESHAAAISELRKSY
jgi:hypothetical protein